MTRHASEGEEDIGEILRPLAKADDVLSLSPFTPAIPCFAVQSYAVKFALVGQVKFARGASEVSAESSAAEVKFA